MSTRYWFVCASLATVLSAPLFGDLRFSQDAAAEPAKPAEPARSFFARPLFLSDTRPDIRSLRHLTVSYVGAVQAPSGVTRTLEEARAIAAALRAEIVGGADLATVARRAGDGPTARVGAELGSYAPGVLQGIADEFLFGADLDEISPVIEMANGFQIFERVVTNAACRQILVSSRVHEDARERAKRLLKQLDAGAKFAELAAAESDDEATRGRGGALSIFERGAKDTLIKRATFDAQMGEIVGPIESMFGWHLIQRVPTEELDAALIEHTLVRAELILISHREMPSNTKLNMRSGDEAKELVDQLYARLLDGASFRDLSAEANDDRDSAQRGGDLGWLHRRNPFNQPFLERLFAVEVGHLYEPMPVKAGWVLLRRSR